MAPQYSAKIGENDSLIYINKKGFLPKIMLTPIFLKSQNNQNLLAKRKIVNKLTGKGFCLLQNIFYWNFLIITLKT